MRIITTATTVAAIAVLAIRSWFHAAVFSPPITLLLLALATILLTVTIIKNSHDPNL